MSNAERQRRFRASHPGYNKKYNRRPNAEETQRIKQRILEAFAAKAAEAAAKEALNAAASKPQLLLPAPAETIIVPGMNTIEATPATVPAPLPVAA
jgi:hypothetical protein